MKSFPLVVRHARGTKTIEYRRHDGRSRARMRTTVRRFKESPSSKCRLGSAAPPLAHCSSRGGADLHRPRAKHLGQAGGLAAETMDPPEDIHASTAFRRDLVRAMRGEGGRAPTAAL
jgi:hypothetical protein